MYSKKDQAKDGFIEREMHPKKQGSLHYDQALPDSYQENKAGLSFKELMGPTDNTGIQRFKWLPALIVQWLYQVPRK